MFMWVDSRISTCDNILGGVATRIHASETLRYQTLARDSFVTHLSEF